MDIASNIATWMQKLEDPTVFLVGVEWKPTSGKLYVTVDGDLGVTIEQCRQVNKLISAALDESDFGDMPYTLEVSSPGADKPLLLPRQYPKHTGREMEVKLKAGTILTGRLAQADEQAITLQLKDKKKRYTDQSPTTQVAYTDISEAKVIISFR